MTKPKSISRVTYECIREDGVITSGSITSSEKGWTDAYAQSLSCGSQAEPAVAAILLLQMELIFDRCQAPADLVEYDKWLAAVWNLIPELFTLVADSDLQRLRKYEADIRSGKAFE